MFDDGLEILPPASKQNTLKFHSQQILSIDPHFWPYHLGHIICGAYAIKYIGQKYVKIPFTAKTLKFHSQKKLYMLSVYATGICYETYRAKIR